MPSLPELELISVPDKTAFSESRIVTWLRNPGSAWASVRA